MPNPIYLDYNATTPLHPEVIAYMKPLLEEAFGNPSSSYSYGAKSRILIEEARMSVAALLGCKPFEIIFTSGGSESNNLAIKGIAQAYKDKGRHIITSSIEHPAVAKVCQYLEKQGFTVTYLPADHEGLINPDDLKEAITPGTILISIMHANNETGVIQPIEEFGAIARGHGILFHTDAAQSVGKIPVNVKNVDLLSVAGHKLYAPKGVGALYVREGIRLEKIIHGANHEHDLRAGTENVLEIAGLGKAAEIAARDLHQVMEHNLYLRNILEHKLLESIPEGRINGHPEKRLPNTLYFTIPGVESGTLISEIGDKVAISAGAACHTEDDHASETLTAMGVPESLSRCTIRLTTGRFLTEEEVEKASEIIIKAAQRIRGEYSGTSIPEENIRLTAFTHGLGCACKMRPQVLEKVLKNIPVGQYPQVMVGYESSDDAGVYRINENQALVQTLDFFTPVVDDPFDFGRIAAANSLSDIYAMGATPLFALNIVAFPSSRLPLDVLEKILLGAAAIAAEADIPILGGHTVDDPEPKFGMAVTGMVHPDKILKNNTAQPGDILILTKPLGTGILSTALKRGLLDDHGRKELVETMATLNKKAAEAMQEFNVHACTDITGYGLLGHLYEMTSGSKVDAEVYAEKAPVMKQAVNFAATGIVPGGTVSNRDHFGKFIDFADNMGDTIKTLLFDAQTSGGLLIAIQEHKAEEILKRLEKEGVVSNIIGKINGKGSGRIRVE
ncbi:MAG: selenide, water dikinase SelD [Bacteroidetes bacterium]|nr:selenide, water dikinase SelD [Bacteroidota bacterium]